MGDRDVDLVSLALEVQRLRERLDEYAPIMPLYSLDQACSLIPALKPTLMKLLQRHRAKLDPPLYRRDVRRRRYRMLSHRDVLTLRSLVLIRAPLSRSRKQALAALQAA